MSQRPGHLFVERQTYRRRRIQDAARFLPVLAIVLMMVPLLWSKGPGGVTMSGAILFLFTLWAVLVAVAFLLSFHLRDDREPGQDTGQDTGRDGRADKDR